MKSPQIQKQQNQAMEEKLHKWWSTGTLHWHLISTRFKKTKPIITNKLNKIDREWYIWMSISVTCQTSHCSNFILRSPVHTATICELYKREFPRKKISRVLLQLQLQSVACWYLVINIVNALMAMIFRGREEVYIITTIVMELRPQNVCLFFKNSNATPKSYQMRMDFMKKRDVWSCTSPNMKLDIKYLRKIKTNN